MFFRNKDELRKGIVMKTRIIILVCLISAVILSISYGNSQAKAEAGAGAKIGIVSIQRIFNNCKKSVNYREKAIAEQNKVFAELQKLTAEIEAGQMGLKTLKEGSSDHFSLMKEVLAKQADLQVKQEIYKQEVMLKQQAMIEELYKGILRETGKVAKAKGLDLVFERSEPQLSELSIREIEDTIRSHKLLYSGGCLDITDEVIARLDAFEK